MASATSLQDLHRGRFDDHHHALVTIPPTPGRRPDQAETAGGAPWRATEAIRAVQGTGAARATRAARATAAVGPATAGQRASTTIGSARSPVRAARRVPESRASRANSRKRTQQLGPADKLPVGRATRAVRAVRVAQATRAVRTKARAIRATRATEEAPVTPATRAAPTRSARTRWGRCLSALPPRLSGLGRIRSVCGGRADGCDVNQAAVTRSRRPMCHRRIV